MRKLVALFIASLMMIACEKDIVSNMEAYYTEAMGVQNVTLDSVKTFSNKVENYVAENPDEKENPLYPKIQANIKSASMSITLSVDTTWDGETHINY